MRIDIDRDFGLRECPSCATEVAANHNRCPICGYEFPNASPAQRRMRLWGGWLMLVILALMLLGGLLFTR